MSKGSIPGYEKHAERLSERYESVLFEKVHGWLLPILGEKRGRALDIGAGSGRDAAGLSGIGFDVVAVEPSGRMRAEAQKRHPGLSVEWIDSSLPELSSLQKGSFDLILASAVWMHLSPSDRPRAFQRIASLLNPGAILAMTMKDGPLDAEFPTYPVPVGELEFLARENRMQILFFENQKDLLGRQEITWSHFAMRPQHIRP
ncbi:MAG: class I SAM-dependent methyltransferase [Leptospirillum sp.]|jgi:SAM-dependent methyltransferase